MSKGFSKVLVCGGYDPDIATCEVIDLESAETTCKTPPNFPTTVYEPINGLGFQETPIVCGGIQNNDYSSMCYSLQNSEWVSLDSMTSVRYNAAAAQFQDRKLLVTGGYNGSEDLNTAEMFSEVGWESNIPSLPVTIFDHCMVTINSSTVLVIGGSQNQITSRKTFFFTLGKENWIEGPAMKYERKGHNCERIKREKDSQEMSIIVVGGYDGYSAETLDEGSMEWKTGPQLPIGILDPRMVEDPNGGVVLIGGK